MFKKENLMLILCLAVLLLIGMNIWTINSNLNLRGEVARIEMRDAALTSKMDTIVENGIKKYTRQTPEGNIDDIINSDIFKNLPKDQQNYYLELKKVKGLLAASEAHLNMQGEILKQLLLSDSQATVTDTTVTFKRGTMLAFNDTTKSLKWNADVNINQPTTLNLKYKYDVKVHSTFERQKDKSIVVKYKLDDPDARIVGINSFIIPTEKKNKFKTWADNHRTAFNLTAGAALLGGGVFLGTQLTK